MHGKTRTKLTSNIFLEFMNKQSQLSKVHFLSLYHYQIFVPAVKLRDFTSKLPLEPWKLNHMILLLFLI